MKLPIVVVSTVRMHVYVRHLPPKRRNRTQLPARTQTVMRFDAMCVCVCECWCQPNRTDRNWRLPNSTNGRRNHCRSSRWAMDDNSVRTMTTPPAAHSRSRENSEPQKLQSKRTPNQKHRTGIPTVFVVLRRCQHRLAGTVLQRIRRIADQRVAHRTAAVRR